MAKNDDKQRAVRCSFCGKHQDQVRRLIAGSETDAYRQIGNAIPPVMFWHISNSIRKYLEIAEIAEQKEAI